MSNTVGNQSMVVPPDSRLQELREQLAAAQRDKEAAYRAADRSNRESGHWFNERAEAVRRAERAEAQLGEARELLRQSQCLKVGSFARIRAFLAREGTPQ